MHVSPELIIVYSHDVIHSRNIYCENPNGNDAQVVKLTDSYPVFVAPISSRILRDSKDMIDIQLNLPVISHLNMTDVSSVMCFPCRYPDWDMLLVCLGSTQT